jgi:arylsulfatase
MDALRNGATSVTAGRTFVRPGIPMAADVFAAGGYKTALFGKWHLGDSYPNLPMQRGFQESVFLLGWGITSIADYWRNDCFDGHFRHNGDLRDYPGYCTDVWFNLGIDWIRQQQAAKEPFFLYLPTNAPHGPCWVADKYKAPYQGRGPAGFFGMIANIDENMGRLLTTLDETGLADNTILIYLHDNGGTAGVKLFNAGMRGKKTTYYEGGHRAACFIRWPAGRLRAPCDIDGLTEVQDLLPTLVELCGLQAPKTARFDGTSLATPLRDASAAVPERTLVVQYGQKPEKWESCVLWNKWRLVKGNELYDLKTDPGQQKNVADAHTDVLARMRTHYESWWAGVEPLVDDFTPVILGADQENPVRLTAADWANIYCDNMNDVRSGVNRNGPWNVLVDKDGAYQISLRRWPVEADAAISAGVPEFKAVDGGLPAGKSLPIARARLRIGDFDQMLPVGPQDKEVTFSLPLRSGTRAELQSWFYDAQGNELCGAYFASVRRN